MFSRISKIIFAVHALIYKIESCIKSMEKVSRFSMEADQEYCGSRPGILWKQTGSTSDWNLSTVQVKI